MKRVLTEQRSVFVSQEPDPFDPNKARKIPSPPMGTCKSSKEQHPNRFSGDRLRIILVDLIYMWIRDGQSCLPQDKADLKVYVYSNLNSILDGSAAKYTKEDFREIAEEVVDDFMRR